VHVLDNFIAIHRQQQRTFRTVVVDAVDDVVVVLLLVYLYQMQIVLMTEGCEETVRVLQEAYSVIEIPTKEVIQCLIVLARDDSSRTVTTTSKGRGSRLLMDRVVHYVVSQPSLYCGVR
jgi:hypothetical protein